MCRLQVRGQQQLLQAMHPLVLVCSHVPLLGSPLTNNLGGQRGSAGQEGRRVGQAQQRVGQLDQLVLQGSERKGAGGEQTQEWLQASKREKEACSAGCKRMCPTSASLARCSQPPSFCCSSRIVLHKSSHSVFWPCRGGQRTARSRRTCQGLAGRARQQATASTGPAPQSPAPPMLAERTWPCQQLRGDKDLDSECKHPGEIEKHEEQQRQTKTNIPAVVTTTLPVSTAACLVGYSSTAFSAVWATFSISNALRFSRPFRKSMLAVDQIFCASYPALLRPSCVDGGILFSFTERGQKQQMANSTDVLHACTTEP